MAEATVDKEALRAHVLPRVRLTMVLVAIVVILSLLAAVIGAGRSLAKPYLMDEMEFPSVARAIAETGQPVYYRGELYPNNVGLWHPPLYIAWYAGWMKLFGTSTFSGRLFGLVNICLSIVTLAVFAWRRRQQLDGPEPHLRFSLALLGGLLVAATSPLLVQGSTLPDIDTQLLPLTLTAFILLMFEMRRQEIRERRYWMVFVVGCMIQLYAKLPTVILIIPTFLAFELAYRLSQNRTVRVRLRRSQGFSGTSTNYRLLIVFNQSVYRLFGGPLLAIIGTVLAFLMLTVTWFIIANLWGVNFSLPFSYLTQSTNNPANFAGSGGFLVAILASAPEHFNYVVQWIGLPALLFIGLMVAREFTSYVPGFLSRPERVALYTFFAVLLALYIILRPAPFAFPKYYPPLIPVLALLSMDLLIALQKTRPSWLSLGIVGALLATYLIYITANPSTSGKDFILSFYTEWPKSPLVWRWMVVPLLVAITVGVAAGAILRRRIIDYIAVAIVAIMLGWQINVIWQQSQASYATTYYYGEQSLEEVTTYLREILDDDAVLIAPKDVGYQLQDRWQYYELTPDPRPLLEQPGVRYLVMRENDYYGNTIRGTPEIYSFVTAEYDLDTRIGAFIIMSKK
jgi:hypothetical protein